MQEEIQEELIRQLNHNDETARLEALSKLIEMEKNGKLMQPVVTNDVNNHIHTTYSFSPYSPTKAVYMAHIAGLKTAGIMDHDSISGAREFIEAGKIAGMATTIGTELRAKMDNTPLMGKIINNPDQKSIAYMAVHGIPVTQIDQVTAFLAPYRKMRNLRNEEMTKRIAKLVEPFGLTLDFERDILPLSNWDQGGSVTERHLLFALAKKIAKKFGQGEKTLSFLKEGLKLTIPAKIEGYLLEHNNPFYEYDLLGVLKSDLVEQFYIDADAECPDVKDVIALAKRVGGISAYAYLGDVTASVTGDKKAQKFEDDYLEHLFELIADLQFDAITYMPSRNTTMQLLKIKVNAEKYELLEISGEDINSPRQKFICEALREIEFSNLIDATWALIGHEMEAAKDLSFGMFSKNTIQKYPNLKERIQVYKQIALEKYK